MTLARDHGTGAAEPALDIDHLTVGYAGTRPVLADICLTIAPGETLGLVGESGAGKTTLSRAVLGLLSPSQGRVRVFGRDPLGANRAERKAMRRRVQMVFQDPYASLNPRMTVGTALEEPLVVHGLGRPARRRERVEELMRMVGLDPGLAGRRPAQLSGGQRQRVAIARALAVGPSLLLCDEPVSALDVSIQAQILNLLKRLQAELRLSMLFISHDLSVIRFIAHRVAVIRDGRIVEQGDKHAVLDRPAHPYTRELLASSLGARVRGD